MCGICGILNFDSKPVSEKALQRMNDLIAHRGPDGEGLYVNGDFGMGHRRLAILDLTAAAHQPMKSSGNHRYVISYNGEVYNFRELRDELEKKGMSSLHHQILKLY